MWTDNDQVTFGMFTIYLGSNKEDCHHIDVLNNIIQEDLNFLTIVVQHKWWVEYLDLAHRTIPTFKLFIEEALTLELKPLPDNLKYVFLRDSKTLLVFVSATLDAIQEVGKYFEVAQHAISWTTADIKGISPSLCMHKIKLDDDNKQSIELQHRLIEKMKEVVKKEILKWLDIDIINVISDSA
ncbi:hypothetical protein GQ457_07G008200 [Hibiscus cannabinus]